jgi:CBS domain containing-hemolysin-like protein
MSSRPEEEEPIEEIEEGEIVSEEEIDLTDEDDDFEINEDEDEDNMDLAGLMTSLLATPDGDTICSALVNLCYQFETQNKILIKMLSKMQPPKSA